MSRPGVEIYSSASAPPQGVPTDTSVAFIVGEALQGPADHATRLTSLDDFTRVYGARIPGIESYDAVDAYFHEGGTTAYFMRLADGAVAAEADAAVIVAGNTVSATSPGAWGNTLELDVVLAPAGVTTQATPDNPDGGEAPRKRKAKAPERPTSELLTYPEAEAAGDTFLATVKFGGKIVQTSRPLETRRDLSTFVQQADYVTLDGPDNDDPLAAGTATLAGGTDGTMPVDGPSLVDALALIPTELGPGQLLAPGRFDFATHAALLSHCGANDGENNRVALCDAGPTDDADACISLAANLRGVDEDRYGSLWAPWATIPGIAPGTSRTVPWSAVQAALCARNDAAGNANQAAAGSWGEAVYATGLTNTFTKAEMETMLYGGVDTARTVYGSVQAYAFRTLVDPAGPRAGWRELNHARLNMAIVANAEVVGQDFVFSQLDGRGHTIKAYEGDLLGMLGSFYDDDALFGDTPDDAYTVNTGPAVNTLANLADGVLKAVLSVRMSPHAELVQIYIVKQDITVALV